MLNEEPTTVNNAALISLGRIEARLDSMVEKETRNALRLDKLEQSMSDVRSELSVIESQARPRTPWWAVVGGFAAIITALAGFWTLFNIASDIAKTLP